MGLDGRFGDWDWGPPPLQYNLLEQWISSNYFINLPEMRKSVKHGWWSLLQSSVGAISEPSYKIRLRRQIAVKRYISTMSATDREKNCNVSRKNGCLASWWRSVAPTERPQGGACNEIRRQPSHRHHPDPEAGVSINSKNGVFYKSWYLRLEFFISMPNVVFYNNG